MKLTLWDHEAALLEIIEQMELAAQSGEEPSLDLLSKLEEYATNALHKRDRMVRVLKELGRLETALFEESQALAKRSRSIGRIKERLEQYILHIMQRLDVKELEGGVHVLRRRRNPASVIITDATQLPDDCKETIITVKALKHVIREKLQAGETVTGAELQQSERLDIK